jgi:hypothetical protein
MRIFENRILDNKHQARAVAVSAFCLLALIEFFDTHRMTLAKRLKNYNYLSQFQVQVTASISPWTLCGVTGSERAPANSYIRLFWLF